MPETIYTIKHEVEGQLDFSIESESICVKARWPFDQQTDEWISLSVLVPAAQFRTALDRSLKDSQKSLVESPSGDKVTFMPGPEDIELELTNNDSPKSSLSLAIDRREIIGLRAAFETEKVNRG